ncbi:MAG: glutamate--tRNA ligase [Burkholderiales bacterium]
MVRTRFAPSPTGYLHLGGARTALYSWAYARGHGGKFVLRIEDTDLERSTEESVKAILDSMRWLGLDWDEGPFFQMQRLARYREVADRLVARGQAYRCWATREELEAMREGQRSRGEKPRYDGRWRPERAQAAGLKPPADRPPVIRFRNPDEGAVAFHDLIKGPVTVSNAELDDLVLLRADGVPTYNFGVVVDDLEMRITHVIRGDDHLNNTPRQVNLFRALNAELPSFAHVPMILGPDGERLSKRHGAVSVMQYFEDGYLPEALVNYLARLGWSHGDQELFSTAQFVEWFDLAHVSRSAAQFDPAKLRWLNHRYLKSRPDAQLGTLVAPRIERDGGRLDRGPELASVVALLKERSETLNALADEAMMFYGEPEAARTRLEAGAAREARAALEALAAGFSGLGDWSADSIMGAIHAVMEAHQLKLSKIAMPLRVIVFGRPQTPNLGPVLALAGKKRVLGRLQEHLAA